MSTFAVILPAAGKSSRFKDQHYKKPFAVLNNRAVWLHSAERFVGRGDVKQVIVVIAAEDREVALAGAWKRVVTSDGHGEGRAFDGVLRANQGTLLLSRGVSASRSRRA